jgi:hypothetical protein
MDIEFNKLTQKKLEDLTDIFYVLCLFRWIILPGFPQDRKNNTLKYQVDPGEIPAGLSSGVNIIHKNTKLILGRSRQDYRSSCRDLPSVVR